MLLVSPILDQLKLERFRLFSPSKAGSPFTEISINIFNLFIDRSSSYKKTSPFFWPKIEQGRKIFEEITPMNKEKETMSSNVKVKSSLFERKEIVEYRCSCTKTHCNKLYCECYSRGVLCVDCNCKNCCNKKVKEIPELKEKKFETFCTCSKTNCNKRYCECFKKGRMCNEHCRCIKCENCNEMCKEKNMTTLYGIEGFRISIQKNKLNMELFNNKDMNSPYSIMKVLSKKRRRRRTKIESEKTTAQSAQQCLPIVDKKQIKSFII